MTDELDELDLLIEESEEKQTQARDRLIAEGVDPEVLDALEAEMVQVKEATPEQQKEFAQLWARLIGRTLH